MVMVVGTMKIQTMIMIISADEIDRCDLLSDPINADTDDDKIGDVCDVDARQRYERRQEGDSRRNSLRDNSSLMELIRETTVLYPLRSLQIRQDTNGDGEGDVCDDDDDGDTIADALDVFNGQDCSLKKDCDGDGHNDNVDAFPVDDTEHLDTDRDGVGDNGDNCPSRANSEQYDHDSDRVGDVCDPDDDNDGVANGNDQCRLGTLFESDRNSNDPDGDGC